MSLIKKILIIFFLLFPISHSFAATLTHVQTVDFDDGAQSENNLLAGIEFNKDGTKLFMSSTQPQLPAGDTILVSEFNLSTPYDISSRTYAGDSERCAMSEIPVAGVRAVYDLEFSHDGTKLFVASRTRNNSADSDNLFRYDLTTPYDISTCQFAQEVDLDTIANLNDSAAGDFSRVDEDYVGHEHVRLQGFEFNNTGTKLFLAWFEASDNSAKLLEYTLSTPYDTTSIQLVTTAGIEMGTGTTADVINSAGIRFSANGKRIFIISHSNGSEGISQISLTNAFDTSSFVLDGKFNLETASPSNQQPRGVAFNSNGLKLYIGNDFGHDGFDQIMEYDLVCPFTIFSATCPSITENKDRTGMAIAQIEIAKRTIDQSTDTALNRLKWIRRNKDKQNLTNLNIDINFTNQRLASLTEVVRTSTAKKKIKDKNKEEDVFYWSEGSIAVGRIGDTSLASTRKIGTEAITVGADKFTNNNGIKGLAFRVGRNDVDIGSAGSNLDTNTFNLTYYTTSPVEGDTKFVDTIIGIGKLNSNLLTVLDGKNLTADRNGEQIYGTIRIKDEIKRNNLTFIPSGRFDIGHTVLGAYKETGTGAIDVKKQHVRSKKIRAGLSAVEDLSNDKYTFKRHGKLEYVVDIDRSSNFKYTYVGDSSVSFNDTLHSDALHNLNGEIGIDIVMPENFSIFIIYERNQALGIGHTDKIHIAIGYLPDKKTNFAFKIDGSDNLKSNYVISKNINDFLIDFKLTNDLMRPEDYEEASVNLSRKF